eukprot:Skav235391  [mRNA]  locus=scaffold1262:473668:474180:- [translate_table: standard]
MEWYETFFTTTAQVYAVLTFDVRAVQFFTVLNLMGGAIFSILVSLPSQTQATWILIAPVPIDLRDAEEVERVKALQPWQGRAYWQLVPLIFAMVLTWERRSGWGQMRSFKIAAWLGPVWDRWQVSILSVMISLFRLMALIGSFGWCVAAACQYRAAVHDSWLCESGRARQ